MIAFAALVALVHWEPIPLDSISLDRARQLHGRIVLATFLIGKPRDRVRGVNVIGAGDLPDGVERVAYIRGERPKEDIGERLTLIGQLRVAEHRPAWVDGRFIPDWFEIRVTTGH